MTFQELGPTDNTGPNKKISAKKWSKKARGRPRNQVNDTGAAKMLKDHLLDVKSSRPRHQPGEGKRPGRGYLKRKDNPQGMAF